MEKSLVVISSKVSKKPNTWTDKQLKTFSSEFRDELLDRMSSKGKCAMVSWALQGYLSFALGLKSKVYESQVGKWNHLWLMLPDGRVLDCTADQFNKKKMKYPKVYLGTPLDIHVGGRPFKQ